MTLPFFVAARNKDRRNERGFQILILIRKKRSL